MPMSHKPRRRKHPRRPELRGPLSVERLFDQSVTNTFELPVPRILYHYKTWGATSGIITEQKFWATSHECTNDEAELVAADALIMEVASELMKTTKGAATETLRWFLKGYPDLHVGKLLSVCLVCFSVARDDEEQWKKYAENGRGLCLGLRVLDEEPLKNPGGAIIEVDYSESSWRTKVTTHFQEICDLLSTSKVSSFNCRLGLNALYRIAAFSAISAKQSKWSGEREFRRATILRDNDQKLLKTMESGGQLKRYVPVALRTHGKKIALAEIIMGPNQYVAEAREGLEELLSRNGYTPECAEYPQISPSAIQPWDPAE
jgi:hypothetical protein